MELFNMVGLDGEYLMPYLLLGTMVVCLILIVLVIVLFVKHSKLVKKYNSFMQGEDGTSLEKAVLNGFSEIETIKKAITTMDGRLENIDHILLHTYQKMALIKYDAFQEMGGNLSFVLALLSASNDGWLINAMHSTREGCYIYAKEIKKGESEIILSEEEKRALELAMRQKV